MPLSLYSNQFLVTSQQTGPPYLSKIFPKKGPKGPLSRPALSEDLLILRTTYSPHNTTLVRVRRRSALNWRESPAAPLSALRQLQKILRGGEETSKMYKRIYKKGKNTACTIFCVEEKIFALSTSSSSTRHAKARRPCKPSRWTRWSLRSRSPECKFELGGPRHLRQHPPSHDHLLLSASLKRL